LVDEITVAALRSVVATDEAEAEHNDTVRSLGGYESFVYVSFLSDDKNIYTMEVA
jgi:hypothetical protein